MKHSIRKHKYKKTAKMYKTKKKANIWLVQNVPKLLNMPGERTKHIIKSF